MDADEGLHIPDTQVTRPSAHRNAYYLPEAAVKGKGQAWTLAHGTAERAAAGVRKGQSRAPRVKAAAWLSDALRPQTG